MENLLSVRFEAAFNAIHEWLKTQNRDQQNDAFSVLLTLSKERHAVIRQYFYDLKEFAELRNALVHERRVDKYIAEPHLDIVCEIEQIKDELLAPKRALTISSRPVRTMPPNVSVKEALQTMQTHDFSQFPIYKDSTFMGLVTEKGVLSWITSHIEEDGLIFSDYNLQDVLAFEPKEHIVFVSEQTDVYDVKEIFETSLHTGDRTLDAVMITKHGKKEEKPLGIITSWDLIKIKENPKAY